MRGLEWFCAGVSGGRLFLWILLAGFRWVGIFLNFLLGVFAEGSMSWALLFRSSLMKMLVEREVTVVLGRLQVGGGGGESDSEVGGSLAGDKDGLLKASSFSSSLTRSQIQGCNTQARQKCMSNRPSR